MLIDVVKVEVLLVDVEQLDYEGTADEFGLLQHLALFSCSSRKEWKD
jgi:hypothetical protein